jgi:hypothetical protein
MEGHYRFDRAVQRLLWGNASSFLNILEENPQAGGSLSDGQNAVN